MALQFRNVDASPDDAVATWPYEALVEAIDRGLVPDWQPIFAEIRRAPWGQVARRIERYLAYREHDGVSTLFTLAIEHAREESARFERAVVAARVSDAVERSGLTRAAFAETVGTSASRLSTYISGKVVPSAAMLVRIERVPESVREGAGPGPSPLLSTP
jgi:DNA-binding transcriptional regulator YiaG